MSVAAALAASPELSPFGDLRRATVSDHAGKQLNEVPLDPCAPGGPFSLLRGTARILVANGPNGSDRPSTGDAMHGVIGRRACFGYVVSADRLCWFSHPRLAPADAFSSADDRGTRRLLYDLHAGDLDTVSEIIWETSGRISVHRAPALPPRIDPRTHGSFERGHDGSAYWTAIVRILAAG